MTSKKIALKFSDALIEAVVSAYKKVPGGTITAIVKLMNPAVVLHNRDDSAQRRPLKGFSSASASFMAL